MPKSDIQPVHHPSDRINATILRANLPAISRSGCQYRQWLYAGVALQAHQTHESVAVILTRLMPASPTAVGLLQSRLLAHSRVEVHCE